MLHTWYLVRVIVHGSDLPSAAVYYHCSVVVVVVVSNIQRTGCQPEINYFTRWPIPLMVC